MEIKDIKQYLNIQTVLQHYGLKPNKHDMLCCPFHEEKNPSLKIYPKTGTFHCFGCGKTGDVIEFIQLKEKLGKHEAILKAADMINPNDITPLPEKPKEETTSREVPPSLKASVDERKIELLTKLFGYFRGAIHNSKPSRNYITQTRRLELFLEIGYNSAQFHHGQRRDEQLINECVKYGMLTPTQSKTKAGNSTGYYVFGKNCIVFPLKDKKQQITGLYFRSIIEKTDTSTSSATNKHYYLRDREGLYPGYPKPGTTRLILTEAIIDAATLLQLPFINEKYEVLSCYGTNGFTNEHKAVIKELSQLKEITIFFDGDKTGTTAAEKLANEIQGLLSGAQATIKIVNTPEGEDVNSLLAGHEPEIFTQLLETAQPFFILSEETESTEQAEEPKPRAATKLLTENPEQIIYETPELKITIWGGIEKENLSRLKVSLHIRSKSNKYKSCRDDVNLYSHGNTQKLIQNISETLEISTATIAQTLTELTEELEAYRLFERKAQIKSLQPKQYEMSQEEKDQALDFLRKTKLGKRTLELIQQSGLVGEEKG